MNARLRTILNTSVLSLLVIALLMLWPRYAGLRHELAQSKEDKIRLAEEIQRLKRLQKHEDMHEPPSDNAELLQLRGEVGVLKHMMAELSAQKLMSRSSDATNTATFHWDSMPGLSSNQDRLVTLYNTWRLNPLSSERQAEVQAEFNELTSKVGSEAIVRLAESNELVMRLDADGNFIRVLNPTQEALAFKVRLDRPGDAVTTAWGVRTFLPGGTSLLLPYYADISPSPRQE